jgi:RNA recognition motif-containing protein
LFLLVAGKSSGEFYLGGDLKPDSREQFCSLAVDRRTSRMKLYIGNLSWQTSQEELQSAFERFGTVTDSVVMMDKFTGRSRGFGFVTMSSNAEGQAAIDGMHGKPLGGRNLTVNEARPKEAGAGGGGGKRY